jgi:hypothetical protein
MTYLNIHPIRIHLVMKSPDVCQGYVVFDIEQYGVSFQSMTTPVELHRKEQGDGEQGWWLRVDPIDSVEVPHYTAFVEAFNFYVFYTLKAKPFFVVEQDLPEWNLHFHDVYFDMSEERPRVVTAGAGGGSSGKLSKLLGKLF